MVGPKKQNVHTQNKLVLYFVNTIKDLFIFSINNFVLGAYIFLIQSLIVTSSFEKKNTFQDYAQFLTSLLSFGQKTCFLESTIEEMSQLN